jgi:hypothetical protein
MKSAMRFALAGMMLGLIVPLVIGQQTGNDVPESELVGTWRLESRVVRQGGKIISDSDLGELPVGYLMYDSTGHMSVQLMKRRRSAKIECSDVPAPQNNTLTVNGFQAYFGTYVVEPKAHTVIHHLEGAIANVDVGKTLPRHFELSGDKLLIIVPASSSQEREVTLHWSRVK